MSGELAASRYRFDAPFPPHPSPCARGREDNFKESNFRDEREYSADSGPKCRASISNLFEFMNTDGLKKKSQLLFAKVVERLCVVFDRT